jgi:hypothetical protein
MAMPQKSVTTQALWGIALILMGLAVFYRIPQVMPRIVQIEQFAHMKGFIYFCFYLIGIVLIYGGAKKLYRYYQEISKHKSE